MSSVPVLFVNSRPRKPERNGALALPLCDIDPIALLDHFVEEEIEVMWEHVPYDRKEAPKPRIHLLRGR